MTIKVSSNLKNLARILKTDLYLVGGYVRNSYLNLPNYDIDIASSLSIEQIFERLDGTIYNVKIRSIKMGTVEIFAPNEVYQHTTFRKDSYNLNGTHEPINSKFVVDKSEDATRRDFTINDIYFNILSGEIYDKYNGIADIKTRTLKTIETPDKVFSEDGLRLLRLVRFATELKFNIDKDTYESAKKYARNLSAISGERKRNEIEQILNASSKYYKDANPLYGIQLLYELHLMPKIFHIDKFKWKFNETDFLPIRNNLPKHLKLSCFLICLFNTINNVQKIDFDKFIQIVSSKNALNLSNKETSHNAKLLKAFYFKDEISNLRKYIIKNQIVIDDLILILSAFNNTKLINAIKEERTKMQKEKVPLCIKDLKINGNDLNQNFEIEHSKIGTVLNKLLNICIFTPNLNNKEDLLKLTAKILNN